MRVYLAGPNTQQQAAALEEMPTLLSFAYYNTWLDRYAQIFSHILIDSGAYSALNSGQKINVDHYADWAERWRATADAIAGLDDISGDWRTSMRNYARVPFSFPTFHDTDPPELLPELVAMAQERGTWLGLGIKPPRQGKREWVVSTLRRVPSDLHVHGWALRAYTDVRRLDSVDSTNWWRDAMKLRTQLPWLTYGETLELVVKRYRRESRLIAEDSAQTTLEGVL